MKRLVVSLAAGVLVHVAVAPAAPVSGPPEGGSLWVCFVGQMIRVLTSPPESVVSVVHTGGVVCWPW